MTFDKFADILAMSRVIAPEAISDPDNYDDSCTLENVRAAYRRLTTPTTGMTFGQATINLKAPPVTAPVRLTDTDFNRLYDEAGFDPNEMREAAEHMFNATQSAVLIANGFDVQPAEAGG